MMARPNRSFPRCAVALLFASAVACSDDAASSPDASAEASAVDAGVDASAPGGGAAGSETGSAGDAALEDAIDARIERLFAEDPSFGMIDRELVRRMMQVPEQDDGPFFMVNLIHHREHAEYPDGRETQLSGEEATELYGQMMLPILESIGARPVFVADVEMTLMSDDGVQYDKVGVVRYPSRAGFFAMLERDDFRAAWQHKAAGVETTLVMPAQLTDNEYPEGFLEVDLAAVPYPPTEEDPPLAIVHLYDYRERAMYADGRQTDLTGEEAVAIYTQNRADQGVVELGVRPAFWLAIEGSLVGDERRFDEFRVNLFPSHATFWEVAGTAEEAGIENRAAGLAHHYTLMTLPVLNDYGYVDP